ncbi:hypothetical protein C0992_006236 [Termitomyces sp. T32_za158]|nr:hypothetical protein C0992_006236 [Termitomyces sp. T32_za158]
MASLLNPTSGSPHLGFPGGRNYDYTKIYSPDKPGEEATENARVWNVYLDEAHEYDMDMIQGFRNIIDGLLVFAALFSAVVTTFVAQTSQALQPDNSQITVSLLIETNALLRAAGNKTSINAVPTASLGPESRTHTSIDVWVNGLFFTSLALSLSTALLSVLAKQWIQVCTILFSLTWQSSNTAEQAYAEIVPGGAKTRAVTRHFRFHGVVKWKLGDIIENMSSTSSKEHVIRENTVHGRLIAALMKVSFKKTRVDGSTTHLNDWKNQIMDILLKRYTEALKKKHHTLSRYFVELGGHLFQLNSGWSEFLGQCAWFGDAQDLHDLVDQGIDLNFHDSAGWTALHLAAFFGNLDVVIALVEQKPAQMSVTAEWIISSAYTPFDVAAECLKWNVVAYLLDHGAKSISHDALYYALRYAFPSSKYLDRVEHLLDRGWDRTVRDACGKTLLDVACSRSEKALVDHLEHYQTVRLPPYGTTPHIVDYEAL